MENQKKPAFPIDANAKGIFLGLTKREFFAINAMEGILASRQLFEDELVVDKSIRLADKLLKQLENEQPKTT